MILPADARPSRVLLIRPRGLGDVVLSSAVIDAVSRAYPKVPIDFITEKASRGILEADPRLDGLFLLGGDGRALPGGGTRDAIRWIRSRRPDLVVDLFSNPRTAWLTVRSGARWRIGLDKRLRRLAYNLRVPRFPPGPGEDRRWAAEVQLDFLRNAGITWEGVARPSVSLTDADREAATRGLTELGLPPGTPFGAVLPGGSWESKRWSPEGFAASARRLAERTGHRTVVLWGPPERADAEAIVAGAGGQAVLAPSTTLREMAALLAQPALLVVTDCLGRHFAVVQGTPTIGLFGTTRPSDWTPPEGPHRTVEGGPAGGRRSLREFPADAVLTAIDAFFAVAPVDTPGADA